ncbi:hypothetical protein VM98_14650 [Streptomyces rubellomurinus subsp. indigoferus]|nr:hypothetical protein VM98_14650 [Streptomyces rubellomurinus subsp. indigoferus]
MSLPVLVPFLLASARYVVVRSGRPAGLARRLSARRRSTTGLGATATEELHALFNANKRVQIEQRQTRLLLRDDDHGDGAPPRGLRIDLDNGTVTVPRR